MNRRLFLGVAALAAGAPLYLPVHATRAAVANPFYAQSFAALDGSEVAFTQYLGKPVVLNFWATWCPPCVKEMPDLEALHKRHGQVRFVGLAIDSAANVERFNKEKVHVSYPLLIAGHKGIELMRNLGNKQGGLPFTVVFDAEGSVAHTVLGPVKPDQLEARIQRLS